MEVAAPFRTTLKGQGQTDPWTTVEGQTEDEYRRNLSRFVPRDMDPAEMDELTTPELVAVVAAEYVRALNATPGISAQRDRAAAEPPSKAAPPKAVAAPSARPGLTSSLQPESDGNYWISIPWHRNRDIASRMREEAKSLGARYKPDDCPASVERDGKGKPKRPWCVHMRFVSEENVARLLELHETGFQDVQ